MDFNEVIAKEKVLARTTARLIYSTQFHIPHNRRKYFFWGEMVVTDEHLCFRLNLRFLKYRFIMAAVIMVSTVVMNSIYWIWIRKESVSEHIQRIDTIILYVFLFIILPIIFILSYKMKKKLEHGFTWDRSKMEVVISGTELLLSEGEEMTGFSLDDESHDIISVLRDQPVLFEISDLSKLSYQEKLALLEEHYKTGKMSKEIYDELKRRMPYT